MVRSKETTISGITRLTGGTFEINKAALNPNLNIRLVKKELWAETEIEMGELINDKFWIDIVMQDFKLDEVKEHSFNRKSFQEIQELFKDTDLSSLKPLFDQVYYRRLARKV